MGTFTFFDIGTQVYLKVWMSVHELGLFGIYTLLTRHIVYMKAFLTDFSLSVSPLAACIDVGLVNSRKLHSITKHSISFFETFVFCSKLSSSSSPEVQPTSHSVLTSSCSSLSMCKGNLYLFLTKMYKEKLP